MTFEEYCGLIREHYQPRRPELYVLRDEFFAPALLRAVRSGSTNGLRQLCREVHPQVYVFQMLQPDFCAGLLEEAAAFESWCQESDLPLIRPNTMNNYGTVLDTFGFAPLLQQMMLEYVQPFSALFYADVGGDALDSHHGFIVEYKIGKDTSLDFHVDASDVTLNVCLGRKFTGGTLFFRGIRCARCQETAPRPEEEFEIAHIPGQAILHRGKHRHGANPILSGERFNLILWCYSSHNGDQRDQTSCPTWCAGPGRQAKATR